MKSQSPRLNNIMITSFWNSTGIPVALLSKFLSNFRRIEKVQTRISRLRGLTTSCDNTSILTANKRPSWIGSVAECLFACVYRMFYPGSAFIKPDQRNPWIKDQIKITLLPTISHLLLPNFVSCGRACPSHMTQNLVTVGAKLWTADRFIVDPWSMDYADPVW